MWRAYAAKGWNCPTCLSQTSWDLYVCAACGAKRPEGLVKPAFLDEETKPEEKKEGGKSGEDVSMEDDGGDDSDDGFDPDGG